MIWLDLWLWGGLVSVAALGVVYWLVLELVDLVMGSRSHRDRSVSGSDDDQLPDIAVVVATTNEEDWIERKLADLATTRYPRQKMRVIVVDGGSCDRTLDCGRNAQAQGAAVELVSVPWTRGKAEQVAEVARHVDESILVLTDADSRLEPLTVRQLVEELSSRSDLGVLGARVIPATRLPLERWHWKVVNRLWSLEGRNLGCAGVSGVCYAARRELLTDLPPDSMAEDISATRAAASAGLRSEISSRAVAYELRVPNDPVSLVETRRRRGRAYVRAFEAPSAGDEGWRMLLCRLVRCAQLRLMPLLVGLVAAGAVARTGLALAEASSLQLTLGVGSMLVAALVILSVRPLRLALLLGSLEILSLPGLLKRWGSRGETVAVNWRRRYDEPPVLDPLGRYSEGR